MKRDIGPIWWVLVSVLAAFEGINAIRSGLVLYQVVGVAALVCAGVLIVISFLTTGIPARIRQLLGLPPKPVVDELRPIGTVHCTMIERLVPIALTALAILVVGAATIYFTWLMGLW